ncbi:fimbrial assembly protein [Deferribacter autotrophicus]|uniref:Fimbrial assembly protein n=1 Tax=Deferribacter autotrophicus TaxID=500465 RepID=A0A5A8F344_9BACT|nr:PilN domain-containing protein [Deferribacter autotrophicus]KAA0258427.1 fimbrial assembly protein [Deferribacter autotrophicus]
MIRINLLPKKKKFRLQGIYLELFVFFILIVSIIVGIVNINTKLKEQQNLIKREISRLETELRKLRKVDKEVKVLKKRKAELQQKIDLVVRLKQGQKEYYKILTSLEKSLPQDVWIRKLSYGKGQINLEVSSLRSTSVNEFIINMYKSEIFSNIDLKIVRKNQVEGIDINSFTITAKVNLGG